MIRLAVIGTRDPNQRQKDAILRKLSDLLVEHKDEDIIIVSGCAEGVDAYALEVAYKAGIDTIGYLPWASYNKHVQKWCTETHVVRSEEAFASVRKYHPAPEKLTRGMERLHASNYDIVHGSDIVIACPSNRPGGGGTGQGMRIAKGEGIPLIKIS